MAANEKIKLKVISIVIERARTKWLLLFFILCVLKEK